MNGQAGELPTEYRPAIPPHLAETRRCLKRRRRRRMPHPQGAPALPPAGLPGHPFRRLVPAAVPPTKARLPRRGRRPWREPFLPSHDTDWRRRRENPQFSSLTPWGSAKGPQPNNPAEKPPNEVVQAPRWEREDGAPVGIGYRDRFFPGKSPFGLPSSAKGDPESPPKVEMALMFAICSDPRIV